jgi:RNA 2',3'-cyclic 3'-phosphodiesterase
VNSTASVEGDETLRLFFGLPLPPGVAAAIVAWQDRVLAGSPVRVLPREHLHITLAFLGSRPASEVTSLAKALREAAGGLERPLLSPLRYRETERVAMLVLEDRGGRAGELYRRLSSRLEQLGVYKRERRPWLAHLTVARFRARPRLRPPLPEVEPFSPSEAALYHSVLRPSGAQYDIVDSVALGG